MKSKILNDVKSLLLEFENTIRGNIKPGMTVDIVLKKDQRTGKLTRGVVKKILSPGSNHPRGIKVMLTNGQVGRVQRIVQEIEENV